MDYKLNKKDTFAGMGDKKRITHLGGPSKGQSFWLRRDIAEKLINEGKAKEAE